MAVKIDGADGNAVAQFLRDLADEIEASGGICVANMSIELDFISVPMADRIKSYPSGYRTVRAEVKFYKEPKN